LEGEIVGVVAGFAGGGSPLDQGSAEAFPDLLLLFVESLLGHLLPGEAEVTDGGDEAKSDAASVGEEERAWIGVIPGMLEEALDRVVSEVTRGDDVGEGIAGPLADAAALGQVDFEEGTVLAAEAAERVEGFDDAGALGPAGGGSGG
jgi:hypothetical protein